MVAILLNMVVMAIESHDATDQANFILEQLNNVFVGKSYNVFNNIIQLGPP